jgi:hypothetical protein
MLTEDLVKEYNSRNPKRGIHKNVHCKRKESGESFAFLPEQFQDEVESLSKRFKD